MLEKFKEQLKKDLRGNKNQWLFLNYKIGENYIQIKVYEKYLQILKCNGASAGSTEFTTKRELIESIMESVERCIDENWQYAISNVNYNLDYKEIA